MFSILIPSWNNLPYLKLCIDSIRRHSAFDHEIIVHVNEGTDGTLKWVREQGIRHTASRGNVGVCVAMNDAARLATREWILFMNDDMVCLPGWDKALYAAAQEIGESVPMYLSAQLIEPIGTSNTQVTVANYGTTPENFDEPGLLAFGAGLKSVDRHGFAAQPMLTQTRLWHMVGGYSIEFGPGMSSDDDFLMKIWLAGCRTFRIVAGCHLYHFACATTRRVRRNKGGRTFILKWGISQQAFVRDYVRKTGEANAQSLPNIPEPTFAGRIKRAVYALAPRYPLGDLRNWEPDLPRQIAMNPALGEHIAAE
ncbi:glycosyltransferase [Trinickia sp. NRRL B-1857]|uniref:glycosyltransferase family 2 protein n=1 Tax=Trinickia sp. NRRL B-1857 TaxID=3162879 RepID=UPI003D2BC942